MTEQVVLVDERDAPVGTAEKLDAHRRGLLHRAFSVFLIDSRGRVLLQQRAPGKYHSPGLWSTTCCSHPRPGETTLAAASRRLMEEMGVSADLRVVTEFVYRAELDNALVEHEFDHVVLGRFDGTPSLNPSEASDFRWMDPRELRLELANNPSAYSFWLKVAVGKLESLSPDLDLRRVLN